ncbi:hypothetical protein BGZ61DRAFT_528750 [Ilyonectria robusta]|uniref:uncharacterized protein n=1 Tax=Ilyonectria robusta TaxID=1079257 RepID=UPI001E8EBE8F|nr:uncharacterized protein BGZ61DRAFT_528750 [Ilyonectria robusta]KAH6987511.1 hypothetical protein BKA56DRAFT_577002 [Ilyonectria sp. MPI-CAGE-AT-0026]KAH8733461.1 hypothetical protein BGZ61DRAFT_528750 [Ilyonectria robusta]
MRSEGMKSEEATDAAWEATKGGLTGAAKWGVGAAILGAAGYFWSPVYRGTTIQFKVYLQMSGMVLGGMIHADGSLRKYEHEMRVRRSWLREKAKWEQYEASLASENEKKGNN